MEMKTVKNNITHEQFIDAQMREMRMNVFKNGKKWPTTKILMITAMLIAVAVTVYTLVIVTITRDTSPLAYLIPAVFVDSSASFKFYCDKETVENRIKLMIQYGIAPEHSDFTGNPSDGGIM